MAARPNLRSRRFWILLVLSGAGLGLFARQTDFAEMRQALASADPLLVAAATGTYLTAHLARAVRWRLLLAHLHDTGYWHPFHALTIGAMLNNLLPFKAGILARAHLLSQRTRLSHAAVGSSMVVESLFDAVILLGLVTVALAFAQLDGAVQTGALAFAGITGFAILLMALALRWRTPRRPLGMLVRRCPPRMERALAETGAHLLEGLGALRRPLQACAILGVSSLNWALLALAYILLGEALALPLSPLDYLVVLAVVQVTIVAPPAGSSLGAFEVVTAQTLVTIGATQGGAGAYAVALHAMVAVPVTLLGLALLWGHGASWGRMRPTLPARLRLVHAAPRRLVLKEQPATAEHDRLDRAA